MPGTARPIYRRPSAVRPRRRRRVVPAATPGAAPPTSGPLLPHGELTMQKDTAGQKLTVFAYEVVGGLFRGKAGDAASITCRVSKDYGATASLGDTNPDETDPTNAAGYYEFTLAQAETNGDVLRFFPRSTTAGVTAIAVPAVVETITTLTSVPASLVASGLDSVAVESGLNLRQAMSILLAYAAGVKTGVTTTAPTVKNPAGTATRATPTVDADGNCSAVTLSPPA